VLGLILSLALCAPPAAAPPILRPQEAGDEVSDPEVPDPEVVEKALAALEEAFKKGKTSERRAAIEAHGEVADPRVLPFLEKGLKDKDNSLKAAALVALRWQELPGALDLLHRALAKDKALVKDDFLHESLIKAIGQHESPSSVEPLMDNALADHPKEVTVARIYALGRIRHVDALEGLMDLMQKTGKATRRKGSSQPLIKQFAVSLSVLTGEAFGDDEEAWTKWWRANRKGYEVSPELPRLSKNVDRIWRKTWARAERPSAAGKQREKRGGDDE